MVDVVLSCTDIKVSLAAGLGALTVYYEPGTAICGRCILCLLLSQLPANR